MTRISKFLAIMLITITSSLSMAYGSETPQVKITDTKIGNGKFAELGKRVSVHYTGWTMDGKQFDSSRTTNSPFEFTLGTREVIKGWDIGIQGMREGGKRELMIPSELAYGKQGHPAGIAPNSDLKFEVELLAVNQIKFTKINNAELTDLLARGVPVIDIRRPAEIKAVGMIKGSHNIPAFEKNQGFIRTFFPNLKKVVQKNDEFIMICSNGRRAVYLTEIMANRKGFTKMHAVKKGINSWIKSGGAVEKP